MNNIIKILLTTLLTIILLGVCGSATENATITNSAMVESGESQNTNFGSYNYLKVKYSEPQRESYIELPVYNRDVVLYLFVTDYNSEGSSTPIDIKSTTSFDEDTITWNTKPAHGSTLTSFGVEGGIPEGGKWVNISIPNAPQYIVLCANEEYASLESYSDDESGKEPYITYTESTVEFTSWWNNITNNSDLYLTTRRPVHFNATMNTEPTWWNWSVDSTPQNHNYDNITIDFHEEGIHYVELEAQGKTLTWRVVRLGDLGESVSNVSEEHYTSLLDVLKVNRSIEGVVEGSTHPYRDAIGDLFFVFLWGIIMIMLSIRHQSTLIPSVITLMLSTIMIVTLPAEWQRTATGLLVVSIAGVLYSLFKSRG